MQTQKKCLVCNKVAYQMEAVVADEKMFHKGCFRCKECASVLKLGSFASMEGVYYCKPCFKKLFFSKGNYSEGFGKLKPQQEHDKKTGTSTVPFVPGSFQGMEKAVQGTVKPLKKDSNSPEDDLEEESVEDYTERRDMEEQARRIRFQDEVEIGKEVENLAIKDEEKLAKQKEIDHLRVAEEEAAAKRREEAEERRVEKIRAERKQKEDEERKKEEERKKNQPVVEEKSKDEQDKDKAVKQQETDQQRAQNEKDASKKRDDVEKERVEKVRAERKRIEEEEELREEERRQQQRDEANYISKTDVKFSKPTPPGKGAKRIVNGKET